MARGEAAWKNAPGAPIYHDEANDFWGFASCTGLQSGYIEISKPEGPYPAMVEYDVDDGGLLSDDARALGRAFIEAADRADALTRATPTRTDDEGERC